MLQEETRTEATEILRGLIDEISLTPENGELRIDLRGELASILKLAVGSKKLATEDGELEQIKVVAGVRNHLYRTVVRLPK